MDWVATGQTATVVNGRSTMPYVCVWNTTDFTSSVKLQFPNGSRAIRCVGFSPCGRFVAAATDDDKHTISVWDWTLHSQSSVFAAVRTR
jgi:WD40 repeat protein